MALGRHEEIEVRVRYTRGDLESAIRTQIALRSKLLRWYVAIPVGLTFAALGVIGGLRDGWNWAPLLSILTGVFFIVSLVSIYILQPRRFFRDNRDLFNAEWIYRFAPDVFLVDRSGVSSTHTWDMVSRTVVTKDGYLLLLASEQFLVIPRRSFRNADDEKAFREVLPRVR